MKNERTVYTTRGCFPCILFSSCNRKNENGFNGSYFYFLFFVWGLEKRKRMLSYPFSIFYYEIEKRKTKGRYIHGPNTHRVSFQRPCGAIGKTTDRLCAGRMGVIMWGSEVQEHRRVKPNFRAIWATSCCLRIVVHRASIHQEDHRLIGIGIPTI